MPRVPKTIEVWVCGACGREGYEDDIFPCEKCGREICVFCGTGLLTLTIEQRAPMGTVAAIICADTLHREGLRLRVCEGCMKGVEQALREVGFKEFAYDVKPV